MFFPPLSFYSSINQSFQQVIKESIKMEWKKNVNEHLVLRNYIIGEKEKNRRKIITKFSSIVFLRFSRNRHRNLEEN